MKRLVFSILVISVLLITACSTQSSTTATIVPMTTSTTMKSTTMPITTTIPAITPTATSTTTGSPITTITTTTVTPTTTIAMIPVSIKIEAIASTWREDEEPYDIYTAIEANLKNVGIKVVSEIGEHYDALLSIEYEEVKGILFSGMEYGTNIKCSLELLDKIGKLLFIININGGTKASEAGLLLLQEGETLYSKAIDDFEDRFYFEYLGQIIATGFGFGNIVPTLTPTLDDKDSVVRANAESVILWINNCLLVDDLIQDLKNESEKVRTFAILDLKNIGDIRAVEPLIQVLLNDESWSVRMNAAIALGELGDDRAVEALTRTMEEDEDPRVRYESMQALKKIKGE